MPSIKEVAALAGVSPATVSRVMNGTAKVDADKRARVLRAIEQTGFVPNEVARTLFKGSAKVIGLVLPSILNPFFTQLAAAIEQTADKHGFKVVLFTTGDDGEKEKNILQILTAMNADGIILATSSEEVDEYIKNSRIPVVVTDRVCSVEVVDAYIHSDHYEGGRLAAEHLLECGCRKMVCLRGPQQISSAKERYTGYEDVCKEHGIQPNIIECDYSFEEGLRATEEMLERYPDADGIIACNDMVAISAYKVLNRRGISVPEQVQIVGFDNIQLAELVTPELTTIAQPIREMGIKAVERIVFKDVQHEKETIFKMKLIVRETTMKK